MNRERAIELTIYAKELYPKMTAAQAEVVRDRLLAALDDGTPMSAKLARLRRYAALRERWGGESDEGGATVAGLVRAIAGDAGTPGADHGRDRRLAEEARILAAQEQVLAEVTAMDAAAVDRLKAEVVAELGESPIAAFWQRRDPRRCLPLAGMIRDRARAAGAKAGR